MLLVSDTQGESPRHLAVQFKLKMLGGGSQKETLPNFKMQLAYGTGSAGLSNEKTDLSQLC